MHSFTQEIKLNLINLPFVGKDVCKHFPYSSTVTFHMRILLDPSHFAWSHIRVGGSVRAPRQQTEHCWSVCIYSVRRILIEFPTCLAHIELVTCPEFGAVNICLVFVCLSVINIILCL